jgi:hypothetical protein
VKEINVYIGPSAYDLKIDFFDEFNATLHPPVKRFDIDHLLASSPIPGIIVIVDGVFFPHPAVGHVEIREAIAKGWEIWGLSSMGAIRAFEMRNDGMHGYGYVYGCFFKYDDFKDDEMALLYNSDTPYHPLTEPLINTRYFLAYLMDKNLITLDAYENIVAELAQLWFGYRTTDLLEDLLSKHNCDAAVFIELSHFKKFRIKTIDVINFFHEQRWGR